VSLVAACIGIVLCYIGPIVAIVFGHIARSRIKRSGDSGSGIALTGVIMGYAEIVLATIGIAAIVLVAVNANNDTTSTARLLATQIELVANRTNASPRDADVVRQAIDEVGLATEKVYVGSTSEYAVDATAVDLASQGWRLEVHKGVFGQACLYVPAETSSITRIRDGSCPGAFG
jgi:hypothetical protein